MHVKIKDESAICGKAERWMINDAYSVLVREFGQEIILNIDKLRARGYDCYTKETYNLLVKNMSDNVIHVECRIMGTGAYGLCASQSDKIELLKKIDELLSIPNTH